MILDQHPDNPPEARGCKAIGYWFNEHHQNFPKPQDYVDPKWNSTERAAVVRYLRAGRVKASWRGWSNCRICNCKNGSQCLGDGAYVWPEGLAHYVEAHGVRPPDEFVKHALGKVLAEGWPGPDVEPEGQRAESQSRWIQSQGRLRMRRSS